MTLLDISSWHGKAYSGGRNETGGGQAAATLDAFTDTRWVTIRGDIAPYPF